MALEWALAHGLPEVDVLDTITCHVHDGKGCGKCIPCLKRYLAFKLNGLNELYHYEPILSDYGIANIKKYLLTEPENKNDAYVRDVILKALDEEVLSTAEVAVVVGILTGTI